MARWLLCILVALLFPTLAAASPPRVVLVPKLVVANHTQSEDTQLLTAATRAFVEGGLRVVELDRALAAQRAAFHDQIYAGKVPSELDVASADALVALLVECARVSEAVFGSRLHAIDCSLHTRVVRLDSGDAVHASSQRWTAHGLDDESAIRQTLDGKLTQLLREQIEPLRTALLSERGWDLDVVTTELADASQAEQLSAFLRSLAEGIEVRVISFSVGTAKLTLHGTTPSSLTHVLERVEHDQTLPLRVTYRNDRTLHLMLDRARGSALPVVLVQQTRCPELGDAAAELSFSALRNLPALGLREVWVAAAQKHDPIDKALLRKARESGAQAVLRSVLARAADSYTQSLTLFDAGTGRALVASAGEGSTALAALETAVNALRERLSSTPLALGGKAQGVAIRNLAPSPVHGLLVRSFQLAPAAEASGRVTLRGTLTLINRDADPADGIEIEYVLDGRVLGSTHAPAVAPLATLPVPLQFALEPPAIPKRAVAQLAASVRYRRGDGHAVIDAFAPWIVPVPSQPVALETPRAGVEPRSPQDPYHVDLADR